jgi:hypothetical protein
MAMVDDAAYGGTTGAGRLRAAPGKLTGTIAITVAGRTTNMPLDVFELNGAPKMRWTIQGATFEAPVATCAARLWTASNGRSAVAVRFAEPR